MPVHDLRNRVVFVDEFVDDEEEEQQRGRGSSRDKRKSKTTPHPKTKRGTSSRDEDEDGGRAGSRLTARAGCIPLSLEHVPRLQC